MTDATFRWKEHHGVYLVAGLLLAGLGTLALFFWTVVPFAGTSWMGRFGLVAWSGASLWGWVAVGFLAAARAFEWTWLPALLRTRRTFFLATLLALAVCRLPVLTYNHVIYGDEAVFLVGAQGYLADPVPWRSIDMVSSGPLNAWVLIPGLLLGIPPCLVARLATFACMGGTLWFLLRFLERLLGEGKAPLALLPLVTFYAVARRIEYLHFSSEQFPVLLLTAALWLAGELWEKPGRGRAVVLGAILAAAVWAKSQAIPLALYLFAAGGVILFLQRRRFPWVAGLGRLGGGFLAVSLLVVVPVLVTGTWGEMVRRYFLHGLAYGPEAVLAPNDPQIRFALWQHFHHLLLSGYEGAFLLIGIVVWGGAAATFALFSFGKGTERIGFLAAVGYLLLSGVVVLKTGTDYIHYLFFLFVPATVAAAWATRHALPHFSAPRRAAVLAAGIALATLPVAAFFFVSAGPADPRPLYWQIEDDAVKVSDPLGKFIRQRARPGDRMAVWGFEPDFYINAGLPPGVRDIVTNFSIVSGREQADYQEDYVRDLHRSLPAFFVDAATVSYNPSWPWPPVRSRFIICPELAALIRDNYRLAARIKIKKEDAPVLVYLRNDRVALPINIFTQPAAPRR